MAGELVKKTQDRLAQERKGKIGKGELYLAHLLGSAGASRLLKLVDERPQENAAKAVEDTLVRLRGSLKMLGHFVPTGAAPQPQPPFTGDVLPRL